MKPIPASLRRSLIRCAALTAVGVAVVISTHYFGANAARERALEADRHSALEARLRWGPTEIGQAELGNAFYEELIGRDIIGPEHRLDWTEHVLSIKEAHGIGDVEYELGPLQQATTATPSPRLTRYELMASAMSLRIAVLHEQQLLDFFDDLGKSVSSILSVRSCRIERLADADAATDARLKAQCAVDWITLRERA